MFFECCSKRSKMISIENEFSYALFLSIQSSFLKISRQGGNLYKNTTCTRKKENWKSKKEAGRWLADPTARNK